MTATILEKNFTPIEYFYGGETFKFELNHVPDYYPAMCRAQALLKDEMFNSVNEDGTPFGIIEGTYDPNLTVGHYPALVKLVFQPKIYHFSKTIEIIKTIHLLGAGSSPQGTCFKFPSLTAGIIVHSSRGGELVSTLNNANVIVTSIPKTSSYDCPYILDRNNINLDRATLGDGFLNYDYSIKFREKIIGHGSIIEGIFLQSSRGSNFDIFPELNTILESETDTTTLHVFNPYENQESFRISKPNNLEYSDFSHAIKAAHGITLFALTQIINCGVTGFAGNGIYAFGNNHGGVTDFSTLDNVSVTGCDGNGIHLFGQDASNFKITSVQSNTNFGYGLVGFVTNSTNTILTSQFTSNKKGAILCPWQMYFLDNEVIIPSLKTKLKQSIPANSLLLGIQTIKGLIFIGCYAEIPPTPILKKEPQTELCFLQNGKTTLSPLLNITLKNKILEIVNREGFSLMNRQCFVTGDFLGSPEGHPQYFESLGSGDFSTRGPVRGQSLRTDDIKNFTKNLNVTADQANADVVYGTLGSGTYSNVALQLGAMKPNSDLYFAHHSESNYWTMASNPDPDPIKGVNINNIFHISHAGNDDIGANQLWLERGFFIGEYFSGGIFKRIKIDTTDKIPFAPAVPGKLGDILFNSNPNLANPALTYVGWIFCSDNQWHPFGRIEDDIEIVPNPPQPGNLPENIKDYIQNSRYLQIIIGVLDDTPGFGIGPDGKPIPIDPNWNTKTQMNLFNFRMASIVDQHDLQIKLLNTKKNYSKEKKEILTTFFKEQIINTLSEVLIEME